MRLQKARATIIAILNKPLVANDDAQSHTLWLRGKKKINMEPGSFGITG